MRLDEAGAGGMRWGGVEWGEVGWDGSGEAGWGREGWRGRGVEKQHEARHSDQAMSVCAVFWQPTCSSIRRRSLTVRLGLKPQVRCTISQNGSNSSALQNMVHWPHSYGHARDVSPLKHQAMLCAAACYTRLKHWYVQLSF